MFLLESHANVVLIAYFCFLYVEILKLPISVD